jgi:hypothetical protein
VAYFKILSQNLPAVRIVDYVAGNIQVMLKRSYTIHKNLDECQLEMS